MRIELDEVVALNVSDELLELSAGNDLSWNTVRTFGCGCE